VLTERQASSAADSSAPVAATPVATAAPVVTPAAAPPAVRPSRWQPLTYAIVLAAVVAGFGWAWIGSHQVKAGMVVVSCAFLVAAVARLALPERQVGLLACRHRVIDVLTLACLGTCIITLALVLPNPT
jgi:Protein of unknown function (DUF3017)